MTRKYQKRICSWKSYKNVKKQKQILFVSYDIQ